MDNFSFKVALRFWHESIEPGEITRNLAIPPIQSWRSGSTRVTPMGTDLKGLHRESYWHAEPTGNGWRKSSTNELGEAMRSLLLRLMPHEEFIRQLIRSGGRGAVEISSYGAGAYAIDFPSAILAQCANLELTLAHVIYDAEQR